MNQGVCVEKLPHSCGTRSGLQVFLQDDGTYDGYCFSCNKYISDPYKNKPQGYAPKLTGKSAEEIQAELDDIHTYPIKELTSRKIRENVASYFGVRVGMSEQEKDVVTSHYYPYELDGVFQGYKVRILDPKRMWSVGNLKEVDLFGWSQAVESNARKLILTEGECFKPTTEVFTEDGWVGFGKLSKDSKVYAVGKGFEYPISYIEKEYEGDMLSYTNSVKFSNTTTPSHNYVIDCNGKHFKCRASEIKSNYNIPRTTLINGEGIQLSDDAIRLQLAISADSKIDKSKTMEDYCHFEFKKERKIERLRSILGNLNIPYTSFLKDYDRTTFNFTLPTFIKDKQLPVEWLSIASLRQRKMIIEELVEWDGNRVNGRKQYEFYSKHLSQAQWVQTLAHTCGYTSTIMHRKNSLGEWWKVSILLNKTHTNGQSLKKKYEKYTGKVYCVQVSTGEILIRNNGCISVCGNCDAMALFQMIVNSNAGGKYAGMKPAVCSIPHGAASIERDITRLLPKIRKFSEIIYVPDQDEAGLRAATAITRIIPDVKIATLPCKDANECLIKGKQRAAVNAVLWQATAPKNTRLINGVSLIEAAKAKPEFGLSWPWEGMTKATRGIRPCETYYFGAGVKMGKCLKPSTLVMLNDGSPIEAYKLRIGDKLMGDDGTPRTITNLFTGQDKLYTIHQKFGMDYTVNGEHILALQNKDTKEKVEVSVNEFLAKPNSRLRGYFASIDPPNSHIPYDPYTYGVWIGDGKYDHPYLCLNKEDSTEILSSIPYQYVIKTYADNRNALDIQLQIFGEERKDFVDGGKHIRYFFTASKQQRLEMLAGIIDTDGYKNNEHQYELLVKDSHLAFDLMCIFKSVGLRTSFKQVTKSIKSTGFTGNYIKLLISGDTSVLPLRVSRKRSTKPCSRTSTRTPFNITEAGIGDYICISTDGNHLFCLADSTVVHNSEVVDAIAEHLIVHHDLPVLLCKPEQAVARTYQMLVGKAARRIFHDPTIPFDEEAFDRGVELIGNKAIILDSYQFVDWETLKDDIRYAVKSEGVKHIILDPITCFTNQMSASDANEFLTKMAAENSAMAKDLGYTSFVFCHLKAPLAGDPHERGGKVLSTQFAGSRAMMRSANYMIGIHGNKDPDKPEEERNIRTLEILEDREFGCSDKVRLFWDKNTGYFNEMKG